MITAQWPYSSCLFVWCSFTASQLKREQLGKHQRSCHGFKAENAQNASLVAYRRSCKPNPMHPSAASPNKQANYDVVQAITTKVENPPINSHRHSFTIFTSLKLQTSPKSKKVLKDCASCSSGTSPITTLAHQTYGTFPPKARPQIVQNTNLWILWYPFWPNNFSEGPSCRQGQCLGFFRLQLYGRGAAIHAKRTLKDCVKLSSIHFHPLALFPKFCESSPTL